MIQPSGLNASSEGEIRAYYDWIHGYQELFFAKNLRRVLGFVQLSLWGEVDPDIRFEFEPLYQMDEGQLSTVRKNNADTDAVLIGSGVISADDARRRLASDPKSLYHGLDVNEVLPDDMDDPALAGDATQDWDEAKHPRDEGGKFGSGGGEAEGDYDASHEIARGDASMASILSTRKDVPNAMRVGGIGEVAFVWGVEGDKDNDYRGGYGVSKIVAKHGKASALKVPETLARGKKSIQPHRAVCVLGSHLAVLTHGGKGGKGPWLLTAYEEDAPAK